MRLVYLLLITASLVCASDWFPLQVGNQWVYRLDEGPVKDIRTVSIVGKVTAHEREYFLYNGIWGEQLRLRYNSNGKLVKLLPDGSEAVWADFQAEEGALYDARVDDCSGPATVESRSAKLELPRRTFEGALAVSYKPNCADAGVTRDVFVQGIGLAEREYASFSGPRRYRLSSARIGDTVVLTAGEHAFRLSLDHLVYPEEFRYQARLTLENTTGEPLVLRFPSGQVYELTIRNSLGHLVYTWSSDKLFIAALVEIPVVGERNWAVSESLRLTPGRYLFEARLVTTDQPGYSASIPFTVQ